MHPNQPTLLGGFFLSATLHPPALKIHDDPRILRPATADSSLCARDARRGARGASGGAGALLELTRSSRGQPRQGLARPAGRRPRTRALYGTPTSNLDMGRRPEWALPLQTRSACRPEGPATPVTIIMGVDLDHLSPPPSNPLGLLASPMPHMSPIPGDTPKRQRLRPLVGQS